MELVGSQSTVIRRMLANARMSAGHLDEEFGFMLGHGKATMTGRYGAMPQGMMEKRVMLINSITYPGLDLAHVAQVN